VLPALEVARAWRIRVRQLVEQDERGAPCERGIEIEFRQRDAAIVERAARRHLEALGQAPGLRAAMRLDESDEYVDARALPLVRLDEHRVGLADAGARAEEDLELGAARQILLRADAREQLFRRGT